VNKGLELMEAHWLFGIPYDRLDAIIHRESIVHSLVEFDDASIKAQLGLPDMRLPIQYALSFPERWANPRLPRLDLAALGKLTFAPPEAERYPCLALAMQSGRAGGLHPAVFSGADEAAVELLLAGAIRFGDIAPLIAGALDAAPRAADLTVEAVIEADLWARAHVRTKAAVAA
jgi:1-deoxy-D-xylulose-5-phosphate reductoisomerase